MGIIILRKGFYCVLCRFIDSNKTPLAYVLSLVSARDHQAMGSGMTILENTRNGDMLLRAYSLFRY
jgi:hypothetical protein